MAALNSLFLVVFSIACLSARVTMGFEISDTSEDVNPFFSSHTSWIAQSPSFSDNTGVGENIFLDQYMITPLQSGHVVRMDLNTGIVTHMTPDFVSITSAKDEKSGDTIYWVIAGTSPFTHTMALTDSSGKVIIQYQSFDGFEDYNIPQVVALNSTSVIIFNHTSCGNLVVREGEEAPKFYSWYDPNINSVESIVAFADKGHYRGIFVGFSPRPTNFYCEFETMETLPTMYVLGAQRKYHSHIQAFGRGYTLSQHLDQDYDDIPPIVVSDINLESKTMTEATFAVPYDYSPNIIDMFFCNGAMYVYIKEYLWKLDEDLTIVWSKAVTIKGSVNNISCAATSPEKVVIAYSDILNSDNFIALIDTSDFSSFTDPNGVIYMKDVQNPDVTTTVTPLVPYSGKYPIDLEISTQQCFVVASINQSLDITSAGNLVPLPSKDQEVKFLAEDEI
mmetsp:Transcript_61888/g.70982  ORF Transcript_61888/g.70982 Transcript_61888/m.70982 type:complete len:448 (+) Transcript_61888:36-1379(+)